MTLKRSGPLSIALASVLAASCATVDDGLAKMSGIVSPEIILKTQLDVNALAAEPDEKGFAFVRGVGWDVDCSSDAGVYVSSRAYIPLVVKGKLASHSSYIDMYRGDGALLGTLGLGWTDTLHGGSVALSEEGEYLLTGAPDRERGTGGVYLYGKRDGSWKLNEKGNTEPIFGLFGPRPGSFWGNTVDISAGGMTLVWGAPGEDGHGAAHYVVAPQGGWSHMEKLDLEIGTLGASASRAVAGSDFGRSVAISADDTAIVVGAPGEDAGCGAVYVFSKPAEGWREVRNLTRLDHDSLDPGSHLGERAAVSADGKVIAVSAPGARDGAGLVFVYVRGEKDGGTTFVPHRIDPKKNDRMSGLALALSGDGKTLAYTCFDSANKGEIVVYRSGTRSWDDAAEIQRTSLTKSSPNDFLGFSLALPADGGRVLFGAPGANGGNGFFDWIAIPQGKR